MNHMNKQKKLWSSAIVISLLSASIVGCSSGSTPAQGDSAKNSDPTKPVTLRFAWWGSDSRHKATLDVINLYKQKNPNVTIEAEYSGFDGYEQKIKTQLAGGTAPDILQLDQPWLAELTNGNELLLDLGTQKNLDLSKFDATYLKNFSTYNNKVVGLPMGTNGRTIVFNKTLAEKLGIPYNQAWTWDNLLEEGTKLHAKDSKMFLMNSDLGVIQIMLASMLRQKTNAPMVKDDNTLTFTKEQATEAFDWIQKAFKAGVFQPLGESQLFAGKTDQNPKWINQELVAIEGWSSEVIKFKDTLPKGTEIESVLPAAYKDSKTGAAVIRPSMVVSVNKRSENQDAATKFVNWLLTDIEAAKILGDVRAVPALETTKNAVVEANKLDKNVAKAVDLASKSQAIPDNAISLNSQLIDIGKDIVQKVAFGKTSPSDAADELIKRYTDKLKELKK
ncbi:ABC transporter substrate-binding protein [Paenibacillus radicis (ex Xue et al. 2023)]|uniref:ABC transporter substrate-binding protein n=1 Tax=Paenibacillus radicis (ex Xue et al. 2023) TaxID=2972489 RepID=A0ABT1YPF5_9BACL|nr:ABC transporter substrate-binding protein [Paenibacillus radicis (ex Xue et al. 2023)]MCR8635061.1 ABC transporter substrate-binding protein [Paenibacillus radicis (ex Xue et al. 2023)]